MRIKHLVSTLSLAAASMSAQTQPTTITRSIYFPPVTLATTETARIILVNTAPAATGNNPAPSCTGTAQFFFAGPTNLPAPFTYTLGSGQFASLDLTYAKTGATTAPAEVVGVVSQAITIGSAIPCSLNLSLVVFDTQTSVGHLILSNPIGHQPRD